MESQTNSSQAPGQLLGYSLQVTECLRQLLVASPGTTLSVEVFEDVGLTSASDQKTAIQTKSSLTGNPIADPAFKDEDVEAVRKAFNVLRAAVEESKNQLQVIVLDHASEAVWSGIPNIHYVEEWRGDRKLVPVEWLQSSK